MLFRLLAVLNLIHGVLGLLVAKLRSMPVVMDAVSTFAPDSFLELLEKVFPPNVYKPYAPDVADVEPTPQRGYLISGAQIAASLWYLVFKSGPQSRY